MNKVKAMSFNIYKPQSGDCSNSGISSRYNEILVLCETGCREIDLDNPPENLCKIVQRELFGSTYTHIEPIARPDKGNIGWMYGGTIIDSGDSRFKKMTGTSYPVHLHDRQETQADYDLLSR